MKIVSLTIIAFYVSVSVFCQSRQDIQWSKNGNSFYNIEASSIAEIQLPSFTKKTIVEAASLVPKGQSKGLNVRSFSFSDDGKKVLIFTNTKKVWRRDTRGDYWVLDMNNKGLVQLGKGRPTSSLMFAKISPDGTKAAYVSEHNIYVEDLGTNKITQLTKDGTLRLINGTFDWAYEEEFDCRDGFRWSPDSKNIAYWQIDATKIKNFLLIDNTDSLYSFTKPVEYPKVGQNPSPARIGVVNVATAKTTWMTLPGDPVQHYIPRMEWAANNSQVILEQLNRKQNEAKIFLCNIATGASNAIYTEQDKAWIDVKSRWSEDPTGWEWINGGKEFLWISEKDGWRHIYRMGRDGKETKITKGNYDMISLEAIDEKNGTVYIMASPNNATQQYLYKVSLSGEGDAELLSPGSEKGTHAYNISPAATYASHYFSNLSGEWVADWVSLPNHSSFVTNGKSEARSAGSSVPEMFQVTTEDNVTMDGWMIKPKNFDSTKKYPVLFQVYSEPASMTVRDARGSAGTFLYSGDMAADGYIQIGLDGRGTPAPKGAAWRKAIYRKIGMVNIRDQAMAARKISNWNFVDTSRIAVWGWSGGGSTTLNLLFQYPEIYKTGISIAPVANQLLYDNIYQERYMGLPQENMEDYVNGSPVSHAKNLRGNLLVIHGTGDDNVHYQGTEILINELVKQGKNFQMMSYPNRTHSISEGEGTRRHLSNLFTTYLKEHCPGGAR
ncbi:S9 family peptidase [Segetibacter aerophilus]|uniref:Peptidase S9 n=1 Tax=Segetibacter aerophilus TaxID=670293 RepID=A0A512B970_9BACT|nr:S9 family peptidase [Segetibacter aerophilus]GEO08508.1 peptidase S9 [Segetibacter aerophilus]